MLKYLIQRILIAVPTLLVVSLVIFGLGKCSSVHEDKLEEAAQRSENAKNNFTYRDQAIRQAAESLHLNKPIFYFSLTTAAYPDTLYRIWLPSEREKMEYLIAFTGNWPAVQHLHQAIRQTQPVIVSLPDTFPQLFALRNVVDQLYKADRLEKMTIPLRDLAILRPVLPVHPPLNATLDALESAAVSLQTDLHPERMRRPAFYWYGLNNQYHEWLSGFVTGNLGLDKQDFPVAQRIKEPLLITLTINGLALALSYLLAIPLGVYMARWKNGTLDRWAQRSLLLLYAMPAFWLAMLLILIFGIPATPTWRIPSQQSFMGWFFQHFSSFILPLLTLTLHTLAILAFQMRGGMLDTLRQDYIRTARAKGLDEETVYWRHAFRNALFPIITVFGSVFPGIFAGSVIVELLFNFSGMGQLVQGSFVDNNHPVLFALLMFASMFTIVSHLIADILYAWADPRVRFR